MTNRFMFPPLDAPAAASIGETLLSDMAAFYAMDSAAGAAVPDSHSSTDDLSDNNSVGRVAGMDGNAADLNVVGSKYLSIASNLANELELASFSISAWIFIHTMPSKTGGGACYQNIFTRGGFGGGWYLDIAAVGAAIPFYVYSDSSSTKTVHANCATGKWVFLCATHNAATKTVSIWGTNSGSLVQEDSGTYSFTQGIGDKPTYAGRTTSADLTGRFYLDSVAIFSEELSQSEVEWIYNDGNGRVYADYG